MNRQNVRHYVQAKAFQAPVGASALTSGMLIKWSNGLMVTAASADTGLELFVALNAAPASGTLAAGTGVLCVSAKFCTFTKPYTGGTPAIGVNYGISSGILVNVADTTTEVLTCVGEVDTVNATALFTLMDKAAAAS